MHRPGRSQVDRAPDLLAELLGPALPARAACAGMGPLFDGEVDGETPAERDTRHDQAIEVCLSCPAFVACSAIRADLDDSYAGVWAAEVLAPPARPKRSRTATDAQPLTHRAQTA